MNKTKKMVNKKYRRKKRNAKAKTKEKIKEIADRILNSYISVAPGVYAFDDSLLMSIPDTFFS